MKKSPLRRVLIGDVFGRLTVIKHAPNRKYKSGSRKTYLCRCRCGKEKVIFATSLLRRKTHSCGCYQIERASTHGLWSNRLAEYKCWSAMKNRCYNLNSPDYRDYGGRGIKVCDHWMSVENFYADMGDRPIGTSLDRINVDGDYSPENCRWATRLQQIHNRRKFSAISNFSDDELINEITRRSFSNIPSVL